MRTTLKRFAIIIVTLVVIGLVGSRGLTRRSGFTAANLGWNSDELELGLVRPDGRLPDGQPLALAGPVCLVQRDIRELQLAKGAVAAGLRILVDRWGIDLAGLDRVYLAGAFGNYIRHASARRIGLLQVSPSKAFCRTGRLLAEVPEPARGFRLQTDHLELVDLGTSFGVHYLNGSPVSRHELQLDLPFRIGAAELGNWNAHSGPDPGPALIRNLSGALDEFALFRRALSDAEIRELYAQGKP